MNRTCYTLLLFFLISTSIHAQLNLVGARPNQTTGGIDIVKWQALDPASLEAYPSLLDSYAMGSSQFDAYSSTYYLSGYSANEPGLLSFNTNSNQQSLSAFSGINNISEFDMSTGKIYTLDAYIQDSITVHEYDISTGNGIIVGQIYEPGIDGIVVDASAFDSNHGIFYYVGYVTSPDLFLYGIHVRDSVFSYTKTVLNSNAPIDYINGVTYDNVNNTLFALDRQMTSPGQPIGNFVVELDKTTGNIIPRGELFALEGFVVGSSCFDQITGTYMLAAYDTAFDLKLVVFNTYTNTCQDGYVPDGVSEIVCDNYEYAKSAYLTTSSPDIQPSQLTLSPNPAGEYLKIEYLNPGSVIQVYSMEGKLIESRTSGTDHSFTLSTVNLKAGNYLLRVIGDPKAVTRTFVKR